MPERDELCRPAKRKQEFGDCRFQAAERRGRRPAEFQYFVSGSRLAKIAHGPLGRRRRLRNAVVPGVHLDALPQPQTAKCHGYGSTKWGLLSLTQPAVLISVQCHPVQGRWINQFSSNPADVLVDLVGTMVECDAQTKPTGLGSAEGDHPGGLIAAWFGHPRLSRAEDVNVVPGTRPGGTAAAPLPDVI